MPELSSKGWWEKPVGIVALAVLSGLIIWLISRYFDKSTTSTAAHETQSVALTPATAAPSQAVPAEKEQSRPRTNQTTKVKVTGNKNVSGNNVAGDLNVVGTDNQVARSIQVNAPIGIAIGGGVVNNPVVNNIGLPDRHLSTEQQDAIKSALRGKTCRITKMGALVTVEDANNYAMELRDAFRAGGCIIPDRIYPIIGGWYGIKLFYHDDATHVQGEAIYLPPDTLQGLILDALDDARIATVAGGNSTIPVDTLEVVVGRQPR